jgi:hypothetical protein
MDIPSSATSSSDGSERALYPIGPAKEGSRAPEIARGPSQAHEFLDPLRHKWVEQYLHERAELDRAWEVR